MKIVKIIIKVIVTIIVAAFALFLKVFFAALDFKDKKK